MLRLVARRGIDPTYYLRPEPALEDLRVVATPRLLGGSSNGLASVPPQEAMQHLATGRLDPSWVRPLVSGRREVLAVELIAAAPKLASIVALAGTSTEARCVVDLHRQAVEGAFAYLEQHAALSARPGTLEERRLEGLAAIEVLHGTSRAADPHLHSHLVVANLARDGRGRFGPIDRRDLQAHLGAASALYDAHLLGGLRAQLGLDLEHRSTDTMLGCGALSSRGGQRRAREGRFEAAASVESRSELLARWRAALEVVGLELETVVQGPRHRQPRPRYLDERRFAAVLVLRDGPPRPREVVAAVAEASGGGAAAQLRAFADRLLQPVARGAGVSEPPLAPKQVLPSAAVLHRFGPRPLEPLALERWCRRVDRFSLERQGGGLTLER